jgi:hypothetical protein
MTLLGGQNCPAHLSTAGFRVGNSDVNFSVQSAKIVHPVSVFQEASFWHLVESESRNKPCQNQPVAVPGTAELQKKMNKCGFPPKVRRNSICSGFVYHLYRDHDRGPGFYRQNPRVFEIFLK